MSKIAFVLSFIMLMIILYQNNVIKEENNRIINEIVKQEKLTKNLIRSNTYWATKDELEKTLKKLLTKNDYNVLKNDLEKTNARLLSIGNSTGLLSEKISNLEKSDDVGEKNKKVEKCNDGRPIDIYGYTNNSQIKNLKDSNNAPIGSVIFNAIKENPWKYTIFEKEYHLITSIGKKDNGQLIFYNTLKYKIPNKSEKYFPISLSTSKYLQILKEKRMFWWNPTLDFGIFIGIPTNMLGYSFGPELGLSLSAYGKTKVDNLWKFFRFGLGYDVNNAIKLSFSPFSFNIGNPIPLITNLYLSPQFAFDTIGKLSISLGINLQL